MLLRRLTNELAVTGQIIPSDMPGLAAQGICGIICNRPDGEAPGQPCYAEIESRGCERDQDCVPSCDADGDQRRGPATFGRLLEELPSPVLVYCRSGMRSTALWALSQAGRFPSRTSWKPRPWRATTSAHDRRASRNDPAVSTNGVIPDFDAGFRAKLADLILWRRDVRKFRCDPLPGGSIDCLLRLACLAPSVGLSDLGASCSWKTPQNASGCAKISKRRTRKLSRLTMESERQIMRLSSSQVWRMRPCTWLCLRSPIPDRAQNSGGGPCRRPSLIPS